MAILPLKLTQDEDGSMMTDDAHDGGPAFPAVLASPHDFPDGFQLPLGMSLRDWFAGQALAGLLAGNPPITGDMSPGTVCGRISYEIADAMLKAREAKP